MQKSLIYTIYSALNWKVEINSGIWSFLNLIRFTHVRKWKEHRREEAVEELKKRKKLSSILFIYLFLLIFLRCSNAFC